MMIDLKNLYGITVNQAGVGSATSNSLKPGVDERIVLVSHSLSLHADGLLDILGLAATGAGTGDATLVYMASFAAGELMESTKKWVMVLPKNTWLTLNATLVNAGSYAAGSVVYAKMKESDIGIPGEPHMIPMPQSPLMGWIDRLFQGA